MQKTLDERTCDYCCQKKVAQLKPIMVGGGPPFRDWFGLYVQEREKMFDYCSLKCLRAALEEMERDDG